MQSNCVRYDARLMEAPGQAYFGNSPRNRDQCNYYHPFDHTEKPQAPPPLTQDNNPKEDQ